MTPSSNLPAIPPLNLLAIILLAVISYIFACVCADWQRLVIIAYNAHYPWPIFYSAPIQQGLLFLAGITGWFILIYKNLKTDKLKKNKLALSAMIALGAISPIALIQYYSFLAVSCTWSIPWWLLLVGSNTANIKYKSFYFASLALLVAASGGVVAPIIVSLILITLSTFSAKDPKLVIYLLVPTIIFYLATPILSWPDYSSHARIIPEDGIPGLIYPFLGSFAPIPFLNSSSFSAQFNWISSVLLAAIFLIGLVFRNIKDARLREHKIFLLIALACFLDLILAASLAQILPIKTITRLVPHWFNLPLVEILLYLLIAMYCSTLIAISSKIKNYLLLFLLAINFLICAKLYEKRATWIEHDFSQISDNAWAFSKANPLIASNGEELVKANFVTKDLKLSSIKPLAAKIDFSTAVSERNLSRVFDDRLRTRWTSKTNGQKGNEWIRIEFKEFINLRVLELNPGAFATDFPRGIELVDCSNENNKTLFRQEDWQGAISFTAQAYPFYAEQNKVRIALSAARNLNCLLVKQIGKEHHFDWSVAEILVGLE